MNAIYSIFNDDPPADYKVHSLSVSDVVIMNQNGDMKAYFVDRFGFQELPDFVEERKRYLEWKVTFRKGCLRANELYQLLCGRMFRVSGIRRSSS